MPINLIEVGAIRTRADKDTATAKDCRDLLDYMDASMESEDFVDSISATVESAIERAIDQNHIVNAVQTAIARLKR